MKKAIAILLAIIMSASVFTACGEAPQAGPVTITIWHDKEDVVAEAMQTELNKLTDVKVVLEKKNGLTEALKMVGNDAKAAPDMYFFAHDKMGVYAEMGILAPITDFIAKEAFDKYIPMTISAATYKDNIYQLPIYFETLLYMYNRRYMNDDEVPKTTDELYSYMQKTTNGGHYGFVEQHSTAYYGAGWFHGFGGEIISADGKPELNTPQSIAALTYHKKFVELMPGESEYATVNTLFREGMAHSTIGGPWLVPTVRDAGMDVGLAAMPIVNETGLPIAPYSGVQGVHVLKIAAKKKSKAITQVLTQLMTPELGIAMAKASGCAPARLDCYDNDEIKNDEMVMLMRQTAENAVPMPNIPEMDVMWTVATNLLVDVNMSNKDITTAANEQQKKAEELVAAMK
ncbi:MAG: extracellular solute-binding protein [Oscillospiraceae bacterium]